MTITLTPSEKQTLKGLQKTLKERWSYIRVTSVLMCSDGFTVSQITSILGIDDNSVYHYVAYYQKLSLEQFLSRDYQGYMGKLDYVQTGKLVTELATTLYTTSQAVCEWVKLYFNIDYTEDGMVKLLHRLGFSYKKTKQVPCEADVAKQEAFLETLEGLLAEDDSSIYFIDGVHPTHNTRSLYGWIPKGKEHELPTVSGRNRVNINGAVNATTPEEVIIEESERINAQSTKELYKKIIAANPAKERIYVICDNARYYKNKELKKWVEDTKIVQVFLPPYSPNLNLIERLWKFMRKKVIDPVFYRRKDEFRAALISFFDNIAQYKDELNSLLTLNFRTLNSQFNF